MDDPGSGSVGITIHGIKLLSQSLIAKKYFVELIMGHHQDRTKPARKAKERWGDGFTLQRWREGFVELKLYESGMLSPSIKGIGVLRLKPVLLHGNLRLLLRAYHNGKPFADIELETFWQPGSAGMSQSVPLGPTTRSEFRSEFMTGPQLQHQHSSPGESGRQAYPRGARCATKASCPGPRPAGLLAAA